MLVETFRPSSKSTKLVEGHKAWQEIVKWFDHKHNRCNIANWVELKLNHLTVRNNSILNIPGYINQFNYLYKQLLEYDDESGFSSRRLLRLFTDGILDKSYTELKRQSRRENWSLEEFQEELLTEYLERVHEESLEENSRTITEVANDNFQEIPNNNYEPSNLRGGLASEINHSTM